MAGPGLLTNIDTTYPDAGSPSVPLHQRDHDQIHTIVNAIDKDTLPSTPVLLGGAAQNTQAGTTYALVIGDAGRLIRFTSGSAVVLTIPTNASVGFPVGTVIGVSQMGAGLVTVTGASGVTVLSRGSVFRTAGQYAEAVIRKDATDVWVLSGDIAA